MHGNFFARLRLKLRTLGLSRRGAGTVAVSDSQYQARLQQEIEIYRQCENVHDLPDIFHYWSNKYLVPKFKPFGFGNPQEFYCKYMTRVCRDSPDQELLFVSVGAGNCDTEVDLTGRLLEAGIRNFRLECLDINQTMLDRGTALALEKGVNANMTFLNADVHAWSPGRKYHIVLANQCLHHFVELEELFEKIREVLHDDGYFVTDDMIGRNGHMRWPEALKYVKALWAELPDRYKYNQQLQRLEKTFHNWDCSVEGFEGIRAQDILPLLLEYFHFEFFIAFGNITNVFVDRAFGHNFDPNNEFDRSFIDRVEELDERCIEGGIVKPTHMMAAMVKRPVTPTVYKHLTPEFCVRRR